MHKLLLTEPRVGSYSALLLLGIFAGYLLARWRGVRSGIKGSHIDNTTLLVAVTSLFGARFFSWLVYFPPGVSLWKALTDPGGGMVFYGGLIFGIVTAICYARVARLSVGNLMDVFAPAVALGLAFGRVGCFMAGCCWGDVCVDGSDLAKTGKPNLAWQMRTVPVFCSKEFPLAVRFPPGAGAFEQHRELGLIGPEATLSRPVHPVQLYETALALAACIFLHLRFKRRVWEGQIICELVLLYAFIRFGTEFFRADNPPVYCGLTLSQVISVAMAAVACTVMLRRKARTVRVFATATLPKEITLAR